MSTETATEELRERLMRVLGYGHSAADEVIDVLRADPSAVVEALGGTRLTPTRVSPSLAGNAEYWAPHDVAVWVLELS